MLIDKNVKASIGQLISYGRFVTIYGILEWGLAWAGAGFVYMHAHPSFGKLTDLF